MSLLETIRNRKDQVVEIATYYGASSIKIFGSVTRGEKRHDSDIDLLMDIEEDRSLLDIVRLKRSLEALFH